MERYTHSVHTDIHASLNINYNRFLVVKSGWMSESFVEL